MRITTGNLGERLKLLRERRGLTQENVAEAVGIARSTLTGIEKGHNLPGRQTLLFLAKFFDVPVDYITAGSMPLQSQPELLEDPDEVALLSFWRGLNDRERDYMLRVFFRALGEIKKI